MSQYHSLELAHDAGTLEGVATTLRSVAARSGLLADTSPGELVGATLTLTSGLWVSVSPPFFSGEDPFLTDFGIERGASIDLQIDGMHDPEPQLDELLSLVLALLDEVPGDAVLHYASVEVWLVRRDGRLVLNDSDDIWPAGRLVTVTRPYERAPLAFATM